MKVTTFLVVVEMERRYFYICLFFASFTIVQTSLHLVFVMYTYFMSVCVRSPEDPPIIFFYLTYLYNSHCAVPKLERYNSDLVSGFTVENCISYVVKKLYLDGKIEESMHGIVEELLNRIELFPEYAQVSERTSVFLFSFIILDGAWIISAVALFMGTCFQIKESSALFFYTPWLIMTACVSIFDIVASVLFGLDIAETTNFDNWVKFVGIEDLKAFSDLDSKNSSIWFPVAPSLTLCSLSSRFFLIWILNWIGFVFIIKATKHAFHDREKQTSLDSRLQPSPSPTSQLDLNTSEARIRSWQQFYGAIETASSHSSKSNDLNVNLESRDSLNSNRVGLVSETLTSSYFAYSDVDENTESEENIHLEELRGQLPWSYFQKIDKQSSVEKQPRRLRIGSTNSNSSATEL